MNKFNLNDQYRMYLQRVGLNEVMMSKSQKRELKRAFMGAVGQMLSLFRDDIGSIDDENEAMEIMKDLWRQCGDYWMAETNQQN